ncbi:TraX family protein [Verminephrobacter aporrectodeae]|uniref:TraX family protein n=1 Tax=Verminephrobacter aporrectodeae TaxID=1110389 RepID=UPI0002376859|nr:TraX family protein [Verminephrobacter aporrectodeae]
MNWQAMRAMVAAPPRLVVADGTCEGLKWLALALMTGDHVNKYLFNATLPVLFEAGRLALPIFVFVLACNLARPGTCPAGTAAACCAWAFSARWPRCPSWPWAACTPGSGR